MLKSTDWLLTWVVISLVLTHKYSRRCWEYITGHPGRQHLCAGNPIKPHLHALRIKGDWTCSASACQNWSSRGHSAALRWYWINAPNPSWHPVSHMKIQKAFKFWTGSPFNYSGFTGKVGPGARTIQCVTQPYKWSQFLELFSEVSTALQKLALHLWKSLTVDK